MELSPKVAMICRLSALSEVANGSAQLVMRSELFEFTEFIAPHWRAGCVPLWVASKLTAEQMVASYKRVSSMRLYVMVFPNNIVSYHKSSISTIKSRV